MPSGSFLYESQIPSRGPQLPSYDIVRDVSPDSKFYLGSSYSSPGAYLAVYSLEDSKLAAYDNSATTGYNGWGASSAYLYGKLKNGGIDVFSLDGSVKSYSQTALKLVREYDPVGTSPIINALIFGEWQQGHHLSGRGGARL